MSSTPSKRISELLGYQILDTEPEIKYDRICKLASYICKTPVALISFLDERRQWFKSKVGIDIEEVPIETTICKYTIAGDSLLEITDTLYDPRTSEIPGVAGEPYIRFYAGYPICSANGERIGTICVNDIKPRSLDAEQKEALKTLSEEVTSHLELARKNREISLKLNEADEFKQLFNNSAEVHCITNTEGQIEFINDSVKVVLGYEVQEAYGRCVWDFCLPEERNRIMPYLHSEIDKGKTAFQTETKVISKSGEIKWFEWSQVLRKDKWLISGRDVSKRKDSDSRLRTLSVAVEKAAAGVILRSPDGSVEWMNLAAEQIIGFTLTELRGKTFGDLLLGEDTDVETFEYAKRQMLKKEPYEIEIKLYPQKRSPIWVLISNTPLFDNDGDIESQIAVIVDITRKKLAEEQLIKAREDALNLGKSKENFLSVMSHEMRTPLNAVIGMTRILQEEDPLERQQNNLHILNFSAQNLLTLINDVLDFTKIETGNLELEKIPVNIRQLVSQTLDSLKFKSENKNLHICDHIDDQIPETFLADSTRLYQVFINLLGNALKFTESGEVKLCLYLEAQTNETVTVRFEVIDTGIGIPTEKLDSIFDPYSQAESSTSRKYGGTGLGLAITKKLIALHQSSIRVESQMGKGTRFFFTINFPKVQHEHVKAVTSSHREVPLAGKVLVVDDNAINRLLARKLLLKWSLEVDVAESGFDALEMLQQHQYKLVLMDIHMPVMDGYETVSSIRKMGGVYKNLPIIALTGSVGDGTERRFIDAGMNGYVMKPFEPKVLYDKISCHLEIAD